MCILDADKEGFLRNETSLIQTAGRAARHVAGECVLFCDTFTDSIRALIEVSDYRRGRQQEYNAAHGITPQSVTRALQQSLQLQQGGNEDEATAMVAEDDATYDRQRVIAALEEEMLEASSRLEFERAAHLRDQIALLKQPGGSGATALADGAAGGKPLAKTTYPQPSRGRGGKKTARKKG